jgi:cyclic-di-GMP-binding biofilm dispersal mediator protein
MELSFSGKHILVVGASGAFGSEFAEQLMTEGARVSGTASSAESSVKLRADLHQRLILNLESAESISNFVAYLANQELDGIVLASGLVAFGSVIETPAAVLNRLMQVNALGQLQLVSGLIPSLARSSLSPFVLSISGVISEQPMAGLAAYSASKTALAGYAKAAAKELRKAGITWIDARPGHTESGLAGRAIFGTAPNFGTGMAVQHVVARMVAGIQNGETDLPSDSFK